MFRKSLALAAVLGTVATGGSVLAESHADKALAAAVKARQSHMQLYAFNLGILGAMAKGEAEYNADAATGAAMNLASLSKLSQAAYWPQGTDSESFEGSRALPAAWSDWQGAAKIGQDFAAAADAMVVAAGTDAAAIGAAMGALGGACGACHKAYRAPNN